MRVLSVLMFVYTAFSQTAGKLQGIVSDDSGKPVAGAYAIATAQSPSDHSTYSAVTGSHGDYTFNSLPPGKYSICVQVPGGPHLNPCQWSTTSPSAQGGAQVVTVASGQILANQTVSVAEGALLQVRLADPNKLISATDDILVGVYLPSGLFIPMRQAGRDAAGRTYDVAVPKSTPVRVHIISSHLQMVDDHGAGLGPQATAQGVGISSAATSTVLTMLGPSAANSPPITFTVTGRK